jgi:sarcosine oxidase
VSKSPDVAVIGLGVNGAALTYELARRGASVVALDAAPAGHMLGSSHGRSRIIREAYYEHPLYVPLVQRAWELWLEMEELTGTVLYRRTGGVAVGGADSELVRGALASVHAHDIEHEVLDANELRLRFPALQPEPHHVAVLETRAGMLMSDACVRTLHALARGYGAELHQNLAVTGWHRDVEGITLTTRDGELHAAQLVIAAGAWVNDVLALETGSDEHLQLPVKVERQVPHWFQPRHGTSVFRAERCPITLLQHDNGRILYTLPDIGHGIKAGIHHEGAIVGADKVDHTISLDDELPLRALMEEWMPGSTENVLDATVCLYTNTPDYHFLIDRDPRDARVSVMSACSGHGFKFAPALAEAVADQMLEGESAIDLSSFALARFKTPAAPPTDTARRSDHS